MSATDTSFAMALLWTLVATAIVAVVAWVALGLLRRVLQSGRPGGSGRAGRTRAGGRRLRIVQSLPLGTRERAVLIEDGEHEYLLGVAAGGVRLLASHRLVDSATDGPATGAPATDVPPAGVRGASVRTADASEPPTKPSTPPTYR